jgi:DNA-binding GntR family transcriptional regulator
MTKDAQRGSTTDMVVTALRNDIVFGAFRPGEWLRQIDLQERYEASRFEIRRALDELQMRGLVEHRLNYGYRVAPANPEERSHVFEVRVILETAAVPLVVARATGEDAAELKRLAEAFAATVEQAGRKEQVAANFAFHRAFYTLTGNPVLEGLIRELRERGNYGAGERWGTFQGIRGSSQEHFAMIDALRAGDAERLASLVRQHIERF